MKKNIIIMCITAGMIVISGTILAIIVLTNIIEININRDGVMPSFELISAKVKAENSGFNDSYKKISKQTKGENKFVNQSDEEINICQSPYSFRVNTPYWQVKENKKQEMVLERSALKSDFVLSSGVPYTYNEEIKINTLFSFKDTKSNCITLGAQHD